jgi:hypothetical protein
MVGWDMKSSKQTSALTWQWNIKKNHEDDSRCTVPFLSDRSGPITGYQVLYTYQGVNGEAAPIPGDKESLENAVWCF